MATLLTVAVTAAEGIGRAVSVATVSNSTTKKGSIARGPSIPSDAHIFNDKEDVLTAISTANYDSALCELTLVGLN